MEVIHKVYVLEHRAQWRVELSFPAVPLFSKWELVFATVV